MKTMQLQSDKDTVGRVICMGQATLSSILIAIPYCAKLNYLFSQGLHQRGTFF